jgi:hypothetical protein
MSRTIAGWHRDLIDRLGSVEKYQDAATRRSWIEACLEAETAQKHELAAEFGVDVTRIEQNIEKLKPT